MCTLVAFIHSLICFLSIWGVIFPNKCTYLLVFQEMTLLAPLLDQVVPVCRSLLALSSPMTQAKVVL